MELKELAPWIAVAITLALSILVPLFTQIANNRHQRKMQIENYKLDLMKKKRQAFEDFFANVGSAISMPNPENFTKAGASVQNMFLYAPKEWHNDLMLLLNLLATQQERKMVSVVEKLNRQVADLLEIK